MSDTVTIHNGHCSYHGPADKAPVWAARAASTDHKISPAPTRSPMNSIAPVPAQTISADAVPAPLTSFEDTTHAWEEGYRAGRSEVGNPTAGDLISREAAEVYQREALFAAGCTVDQVEAGLYCLRALPAAPTGKEIW